MGFCGARGRRDCLSKFGAKGPNFQPDHRRERAAKNSAEDGGAQQTSTRAGRAEGSGSGAGRRAPLEERWRRVSDAKSCRPRDQQLMSGCAESGTPIWVTINVVKRTTRCPSKVGGMKNTQE